MTVELALVLMFVILVLSGAGVVVGYSIKINKKRRIK